MNPALWIAILADEYEIPLGRGNIWAVVLALFVFPALCYVVARGLICWVDASHCIEGVHWHLAKEECWSFPRDLFRIR